MKQDLLRALQNAHQASENLQRKVGMLECELEDIRRLVDGYDCADDGEVFAATVMEPLVVRIDRLLCGVPAADLCNYGCSGDEAPEDVKPQGFHTAL